MRLALIGVGTLAIAFSLQTSGNMQEGMGGSRPSGPAPAQVPRLKADFAKGPLQFIPNEGQIEGPAAFCVSGKDKAIYFAPGGLTYVLNGPGESAQGRPAAAPGRWVVKLDFVDADPEVTPVSLEKSGAVVSYFKGGPKDWTAGLKASSRITYRELWPGIDLIYSGSADRMKYEFIVRPGADPARIKLAYRGAESVNLTEAGRLAVATPLGGFEDDVPVAWQQDGKSRTRVPVAYSLSSEEAAPGTSSRIFGFDVGKYDKRLPLVLDPAVIVYCGYIGSMNLDEGKAIAVDGAGNAYITGYVTEPEGTFPVTVGPDLTWNGYPEDAFVAKVKADGTGLAYCGFIGGNGTEEGNGIAVDAEGSAYVTGETSSPDFPVTAGELALDGGQDAFVVKVKADGTGLVYSGRIGGTKMEAGYGIAIDGSGCAYVTGWTDSGMDGVNDLPVKVGPDLTYNGGQDIFVAKVKADGSGFVYCGYIGGWAQEEAYGIAVDGAGNAYVTGRTASPGDSFPVKVGPDLTQNDWYDAFVLKVKADGTGLDYCGYIGSYYDDIGRGIAVDGSGNAYVTGWTDYEQGTFPVTVGPDLTYNGGAADAFVAKVNADGSSLAYCGYIGGYDPEGGYGLDHGFGIAVDSSGNAYVAGATGSSEVGFPVVAGPDLTFNGRDDGFVAKVNTAGTALSYCGYIGGEYDDSCVAIAVDGSRNVYVTGRTSSSEATFPVAVGPDLSLERSAYAEDDAFVAKISSPDVPAPGLSSLDPSSSEAGGPSFTLSLSGDGFKDGAVVRWDGDKCPTTFLNEGALNAEIDAAIANWGRDVVVTVQNPDGGVSDPLAFTLTNPVPSLMSLEPPQILAHGLGFALALYGSNFVASSSVRWDGEAKPTLYVSGSEIWAAIDSEAIRNPSPHQITVVNPSPAGGTSNAVSFPVAGFTLGASSSTVTVTAGQPASYTLLVAPQYGTFDAPISLECIGLPNRCTASFSSASVTPGTEVATVTLTLSTSQYARESSGLASVRSSGAIPPAAGMVFLASLVGLAVRSGKRAPGRLSRRRVAAACVIVLAIFIARCGGGGDGGKQPYTGTPKGAHQITVQGTSGYLIVRTEITLIVK